MYILGSLAVDPRVRIEVSGDGDQVHVGASAQCHEICH